MASRQFYYQESTAEATTTSNTYQNKTTLTFTPDDNSDYYIFAVWLQKHNSDTDDRGSDVRLIRTTGTPKTFNNTLVSPKEFTDYDPALAIGIDSFGASPGSHSYAVEYRSSDPGGGQTTSIKGVRIVAIKKDALDQSAESEARSTSTVATFTTKTTLNFTPSSQGDYIIIASAEVDNTSADDPTGVQLDIDGVDYSYGELRPHAPTTGKVSWSAMKKVNLTAASHTILIEFSNPDTGTSGIQNARIVAIRADTLTNVYYDEDDTRQTTTTSASFVDSNANLTQTPAAEEHLILATAILDRAGTTTSVQAKLVVDGVDIAETIHEPTDTADKIPFVAMTVQTLTNASTNFKTQFKGESGTTVNGIDENRLVVMQLVATVVETSTHANSVKANILATHTQDNSVKAYNPTTRQENSVKSNILVVTSQPNSTKSNILVIDNTTANSVKANILATTSQASSVKGNILAVSTQPNSVKANILATYTQDNSVVANIVIIFSSANSVKANILATGQSPNSVKANILAIYTQDNSVKANIPGTKENSVKANILVVQTKANSIIANIVQDSEYANSVKSNILVTTTQANSVKAYNPTTRQENSVTSEIRGAPGNWVKGNITVPSYTQPNSVKANILQTYSQDNSVVGNILATYTSDNSVKVNIPGIHSNSTKANFLVETTKANSVIGNILQDSEYPNSVIGNILVTGNTSDNSSKANILVTTTQANSVKANILRTVFSHSGPALGFDGVNDKVDFTINNHTSITNTTPITISMWVQNLRAGTNSPSSQNLLAYKYTRIYLRDSSIPRIRQDESVAHEANGTTGLAVDGTVHHLLGVYEPTGGTNSTLRFYLDGVLKQTNNYTTLPTSDYTGATGTIGRTTTNFGSAVIDEVRIYHRAFSTAEAQDHYKNKTDPETPAAEFRFSEGSGSTTADNSGNGQTGTITGAEWTSYGAPSANWVRANILVETTQANSVKGNILQVYTQDNSSKANILVTYTFENSVKANIQATYTQANSVTGNILTTYTQDNSVIANINRSTFSGNSVTANILQVYTQENSVKANILVSDNTNDNSVKSNLLAETTKANSVMANILASGQQVNSVIGNILVTDNTYPNSSKANILVVNSVDNSVTGNLIYRVLSDNSVTANILATYTQDNTAKANILVTGNTVDNSVKSNILATSTKDNSVMANILQDSEQSNSVKANILNTYSQSASVKANIKATYSSDNSVLANILVPGHQLNHPKANILVTGNTSDNSSKANILVETTQPNSVIGNILQLYSQENLVKGNILVTDNTISNFSKANILVTDNTLANSSKASIVVTETKANSVRANLILRILSDNSAKACIRIPIIYRGRPYQNQTPRTYIESPIPFRPLERRIEPSALPYSRKRAN